jgi:hypothetical protein
MNIICFIGIHMYLYYYYYYNDPVLLMVYINGILYHGTEFKIFKYHDIICNFFVASVTTYNLKSYRIYCLISILVYLLNIKFYKEQKKNISNLIHVLGVQLIGLMTLIQLIEESLCI